MKKRFALLAFAALTLTAVAGCQKASAPKITNAPSPSASVAKTDDHDDNAPRITLADAKKDFDDGKAVFVDTRAEVQYQAERVKGSINVPMEAFEMRYKSIPTGKKIIAYCSWPSEHTSASLVTELKKKGIGNAYALIGGTQAWKTAGYPMESTKK